MLVKTIAVAWSLFQLGIASVVVVSSTHLRSIHLAFALALIYLTVKPKRERGKRAEQPLMSPGSSVRWWEVLLALAAALCALYIVMDYAGIASRVGQPILRDRWLSLGLIVFLFEASRRMLGPALPSIGVVVSLLAFLGPHLPPQIAFRGISLDRYLSQIALTNEGIFGIPLGVSANFVFLFVLLGSLLDRAGGGKWFIELATALLGRFRGGPAKAAVVASSLVGTVSGSSIANVVTSGTFTIPLMKSIGYPPHKAGAIETTASTYGQLMPPIMGAAAFIMAEYINIPYLAVIKSALLPALMAYTGLFFVVHLEALKLGLKGLPPEELPPLKEVFLKGIHFLIPLGVLIYKLVVLRHTPESSAFFTVLALVAVMVVKEVWSALRNGEGVGSSVKVIARFCWDGLAQGAISMTSVAVATACAGVVIGVMMMGPGGLINEAVEKIAGGKIFILLLMTTIACLVLGMGLPTTANYIVMASLTAPILVQVGAKAGFAVPLIAAHMFIFFYGVQADITPPVALAAFAASGIAGSEPLRTGVQAFRYALPTFILPYLFIFNPDLLLLNVTSGGHLIFVILTAILGMLAIVAFINGYFLAPNRWYETLILGSSGFIFAFPHLMNRYLPSFPAYLFDALSLGLLILVGYLQWQRGRKLK